MSLVPKKARRFAILLTIVAQFVYAAAALPRLIDLHPHCNLALTNSPIGAGPLNGANNLAALPAGTNLFAEVPFNVSGVVQLTSQQAVIARRKFPDHITGIKVDAPASRIHLLHGAGWNDLEETQIAKWVIHYADGQTHQIPIVYGTHVYDWWENEDVPKDRQTKLAWTGMNPISKRFGTNLRIYRTTFANPRPAVAISHLDFHSAKKQSAPFLLGLTVE